MKLINNFRSPNFDNRKLKKIDLIIIHYTALKSCEQAISYLCDPSKKVSSHYLISQNGDIFYLVNEKKRAWHAGVSYWDGLNDINSVSIGIELDFSNKKNNNKYSKKMINSLIILLNKLKKKYKINSDNILGHSDVAPYRKIDPGFKFPWSKIYNYRNSFNSIQKNKLKIILLKKWFKKNNIISKEKISLFILAYLGYEIIPALKNKSLYNRLISAYQSHFIQSQATGRLNNSTIHFMYMHFLNNILTKNKKNLLK